MKIQRKLLKDNEKIEICKQSSCLECKLKVTLFGDVSICYRYISLVQGRIKEFYNEEIEV